MGKGNFRDQASRKVTTYNDRVNYSSRNSHYDPKIIQHPSARKGDLERALSERGLSASCPMVKFAKKAQKAGWQGKELEEQGKKAGFTLVELLVVIAIISILAGMLLPALENSIEQGRRSSCSGNEKQIGIGVTQYCDEGDGKMPFNFQPGGDASYVISSGGKPWDIGPMVKSGHIDLGVMWCPNARNQDDGAGNPLSAESTLYGRPNFPLGESYSSYLKAGSNMPSTSAVANVNLVLARNDNRRALFAEWIRHHKDGVNALFTDGHVKYFNAIETIDFGDPINDGLWPIFRKIYDDNQ